MATLDDALAALGDSTEALADTQSAPSFSMPKVQVGFDTKLSPAEEQAFQAWKSKNAPRDSGHDYDLRGAYAAGVSIDPATQHWPDTYKKPNHPTFSDQSIYSSLTGTRPGTWQGDNYTPMGRAQSGNPLDAALEALEGDGTEPLRDAVNLGTQKNQANSTKILQLFGKTDLPKDFIERNLDFVEQESRKQSFDAKQLMKDSPAYASWLAEHPDHVSASGPDVAAMSLIEKQFRNIPAQFEQGKRTVEYSDVMLGVVQGLLGKTDVTALRKRQAELEAEMGKTDVTGLSKEPGVGGVIQRAPGWMAQQLPVLGRTLQEQVKTGATGLAVGALGGGAVGGLPGAMAGGLAVGGASWRVGAAVSSAKMEFAQAFGEYEKLKDENGQSLDQATAMGLAGMVGVVNGSIDGFFGIEGLTSKLPGINQFTRDGIKELLKTPTTRAAVLSYARTVGQVMATEGATEALQMYITKAGGVALQAVKDGGSPSDWLAKIFSPENLEQAMTEVEAGAFGGGGIASVMATPGLAADISKVRQANKAKQAFESIGKNLEGTKFAKDLPGPLRDIIARATEGGPVEQVYVPSEAFNTYFQKEGVDPRAVYQEITGNVEAYDQAVQTGADLPIATADYAQKLAGTKHNAFFVQELRADLDAMNAREAEQWVKDQDAQAEAEAAAIAQPGIQSINTDPAAEVRKDIAGQLQGIGFDPAVVDQYAGLFESRYRARAERRGLGETAADLFKQNNLSVTKGGQPQEAGALGQTFRQGGQQPLWAMSPDELLAGLEAKDAAVIAADKKILGDRYEEYKKLERQVNSDRLEQSNPEKYNKAKDRYNDIFDSLTKEQQDALFGIGETDAQVDEYRTYRSALNDIYGDTPEELGQSLSRAITEVGDGTDPSTMTRSQQVAFAQIRWAMQEAKRMGWDLKQVSDAAIRSSAGRFSDPQDAEFMLQRFLKTANKAVQQTNPTVEGQTFAQGGTIEVDGAQRSTENSNGQTIGKTQEAIENFWRWFGNSQVVDAQGRPMVVYHGTGAKFSTFNKKKSTQGILWFTSDKSKIEASEVGAQGQGVTMNLYAKIEHPADWKQYDKLGLYEFKREGLDGALLKENDGAFDGFVFEPTQLKSVENKGAFSAETGNIYKQGDEGAKGSITFGNQQINIKLLEKADLSTFIHETGHLYLNELIDDATVAGVPQQLRDDLDTVLKWMGLDVRAEAGADAIKAAIKTKHHEQFARGFEAYTMEGKSPSQAMREAFAAFRQWLIQAYRSLTTAPLNVKLTKDVREVLDRMIATDEEIDAAAQEAEVHPLFTTAVSAGMSTIEFTAYQDTVKQASMTARETLQKQLMAQYQRKHEKWWKTELEATQLKVLERVNDQPEYVALSVLQTGTMPDGRALPDGIEPMKLDRKAIADQFGQDFLTQLPHGTMRKGGMHPDTAAPLFGFNSGQELVLAIVNARPKFELINAQADQEMQDRHGDMRFDGTIADTARTAVMNEHQDKVIAAEIRALNAKAREVKPFVKAAEDEAKADQKAGRENMRTLIPPMDEVRESAKQIISRTIIRKLRPYDYFITAQRASREATDAAGKHEYLRAGLMKQRELMNLALYREATKAKEQVESIVAHMLTLESKAAQQRLGKAGADYLDRINDMLERYEFATVSLKRLDQRQSFREWIQEKQDNGETLGEEYEIPNSILDESRRKNYKEIPFEEILGIRDTVRQIEHFASMKNTLMKAQGIQEKDALRFSLLAALETAFKDRGAPPLTANGETSMQKASNLAQQLDASLLKTELFVEWLDGGKAGPWHDALWNPVADAQNEENDLTKTITEKVAALVLKMPQSIRSKMMEKVTFNGVDNTMVRKDLLGVGMNIGNESNYSKLLKGMNWTAGQVQDMADALTAEEISFLNGMFDTLESLWPQIAALQKRLTGIEPVKIEAKPFTAKNGIIKGGYYPIMYDPIQSKQGSIQLGDQIGNLSNTMRATIPGGHRKARVEGFARPFNLNIDALPAHTAGVIHDLTHREWFMDARWITDDTRIRAALQRHVGSASVTRLSDWVNQIANDRNFRSMASMAVWEKGVEHLRYNAMIVGMAFRASTMISQFSGVAPAIAQIGGKELDGLKWFSKGVVTALSRPRSAYEMMVHKSGEMRHRINTRDRDIRSQLLLLQGKSDPLSDVRRVGLELIGLTELMISMPSWLGGYYKALAADKTDKQAIYEADSVVRLGQGAGGAKDLSAVMARSDTLMRVLTMYHTPFSALYSQLRSIGHDFGGLNPKSVYQLSVRLFYTVALAATLGALASGKGPDEKKDEDWMTWLMKNVALYPFLSVPVLRDVMSAIINDYSYSFTPLQRAIESQATLGRTASKVVMGEKDLSDLAEKSLPAFSYLLGLPTSQLEITGTYLYDLANDKAHPDDLFQFVHDLIYKRPKDD